MARLQKGTVGILPAGALGVAFFHHLTGELMQIDGRVTFLERTGSASGATLRRAGTVHIGDVTLTNPEIWRPDLLTCFAEGRLPEIVLVCTQPDQLLGLMRTIVRLLEQLETAGTLDDAVSEMPIFVLCSNGIYFQRVRQYFIEVLEEAITFGRLPELWPERMPRIVGRLLRGVTIQTGQREGEGANAIYRPGKRGRTRLAGGDAAQRARVAEVLTSLGGWVEVAAQPSATRVEFDKALINLCANLLGQLQAIDESGRFHVLTVREILAAQSRDEMRELARHVIDIGRAVGAYARDEKFEPLYEEILAGARQHLDHVPSSLQWIEQQLRRGLLQPRLTPTEQWLIEPLIRYAHGAGLEEAAHYFEHLTRRVEHRLAQAIAAQRAVTGAA
jgi:hypothetical protein